MSRQRQWATRPDRVKAYLRLSAKLTDRVDATLTELELCSTYEPGTPSDTLAVAVTRNEQWVADDALLRGQIARRVLQGEKIRQEEKIFSVFEPYTRWNAKGKATRPVELEVPLTVLEEASGFVLA